MKISVHKSPNVLFYLILACPAAIIGAILLVAWAESLITGELDDYEALAQVVRDKWDEILEARYR